MSFYASNFDDLKVNKNGYILELILNNPIMSNAITVKMIDSLTTVLRHADRDPEIRVITLSGEGRSFCAGGDIKAMKDCEGMFSGDSFELRNNYSFGIQEIPRVIESLQKPIVALVNGAAIGAGCDLAAMCDLRIASDRAKFGETFTKLSLVPGDGGPYFLSRVVGYTKAMEMYLTGDIYTAQESKEFGLISDIVAHEDLKRVGLELAQKISSNAPAAVQFTKLAMKRALKDDINSHLDMMSAYQGICQRLGDHFEAIDAFNEKRVPEFKGE